MTAALTLHRNALGRLVLTLPDGTRHEGVVPVRAFPLAAPEEGLSLVSAEGREVAWVHRLAELDAGQRRLLEEELAPREFIPRIERLVAVSSFITPCTWTVETDRGPTDFQLKAEEDIRRLPGGALLISAGSGVLFSVTDRFALDRPSRRLLERFL
ncbi:DUF1854 domain-containing protein [Aquabacterium sp. J223]|uniref:cyanophycin metabolism-associated DUF1854 family protein n=1 Tax=Aquabacterium sp. J223 TaxID=2898431 RepID=UPI0021ADAE94|nr:DUF1854 domain-containing protein [Aquabacterium sp. J223]UUX96489.1 DUF1854 domain-containing protein [Aquabacterium sp. J223]